MLPWVNVDFTCKGPLSIGKSCKEAAMMPSDVPRLAPAGPCLLEIRLSDSSLTWASIERVQCEQDMTSNVSRVLKSSLGARMLPQTILR